MILHRATQSPPRQNLLRLFFGRRPAACLVFLAAATRAWLIAPNLHRLEYIPPRPGNGRSWTINTRLSRSLCYVFVELADVYGTSRRTAATRSTLQRRCSAHGVAPAAKRRRRHMRSRCDELHGRKVAAVSRYIACEDRAASARAARASRSGPARRWRTLQIWRNTILAE